MYEVPGDYLLMYDPSYIEEHNDSSDFEAYSPKITKTSCNRSLQSHKKIHKNTIEDPLLLNIDEFEYPIKLSREYVKETWDAKVQVSSTRNRDKKKERNYKNLNSGDQPEQAQSKLSLIRHKVIPCLSNIFRRSRTNTMPTVKENHENIAKDNNVCQYCGNCERKRRKKQFKREQNYAIQPLYAIQGNIHEAPAPFTPKATGQPLQNRNFKKSRNHCYSCSPSSSESDTQLVDKMKYKKANMKKIFKTEMMKEHWKYQQNQHFKNRQQQYPSKDHKSLFQVFSSPYQQSRTNLSASDSQYTNECSSSGFWDYLFDKINRKYQVDKVETPKPCQCSSGEHCCSSNCQKSELKPEQNQNQKVHRGHQQNPHGKNCTCSKPKPEPPVQKSRCCKRNSTYEMPPLQSPMELPLQKNSLTIKIKPQEQREKVRCECSKADKQSKALPRAPTLPSEPGPTPKPCQQGHDEIAASVADKYKGEILCIHNPPCILINGCLNMPPPKNIQQQMINPPRDSQQPMSFWPVTETKKSAFHLTKKAPEKFEQGCQYIIPYAETQQRQTPKYKTEKHIQSICPHKPPCEVVRGCYKPKYDPRLRNSCVHVPMCKNIPECTIGTRVEGKLSCEHRPRCPNIPICSRNYTVLTARENFGSQVRPKTVYQCRHVPPCILIPKCLGRALCDNFIPYEAIPDCVHHPPCEMIPACCRKSTKEMVSVSSQYPNSCRIV